jgi:4-carboxymuconolactone decarboxylase
MEGVTEEEYDDLNATDIPGATKPGLSGAASRNHEELWPGYRSTAMQTDPEPVAVFNNFALDDDPFIFDSDGWHRVPGKGICAGQC